MLFSRLKISIALIGQILYLCDARFLDLSNVRVVPGNIYREPENRLRTDHLEKRQDDGSDTNSCNVCGVHSCGSTSCEITKKRDISHDFAYFNTTEDGVPVEHLSKRVLKDVAEGKIAEYLEIENLNPFNKALCPWIGNTRPTFCIQQRFSDATSEDLDSDGHWVAATRPIALSGCTVLVLVSTRAVYACHIWEDAHFLQMPPGGRPAWYTGRYSEGFDKVINMFRGEGGTPWAVGPGINFELFTKFSDKTIAFIMTPRARDDIGIQDPNSQLYPAENRMMVDFLQRNIPGLSVIKYNYNPDRRNTEEPKYRGQALFEYDPNAHGQGEADWRVWFEHASFEGRNLIPRA